MNPPSTWPYGADADVAVALTYVGAGVLGGAIGFAGGLAVGLAL